MPTAISRPPTSFCGREQELADLARMLADPLCRLITLLGPGGIGKTRLALELASYERERQTAVTFVALQPVAGPDMLVEAIADVIDLNLNGEAAPFDQLLDALRPRRLLLVLDNFEHLVDGAETLASLLAEASQLKLLVTSREVLGLQEEWLYPLDGLPVLAADGAAGPALALFVERARRVQPDFRLGPDTEPAVREICQLVDGLPLAIELAAAWARTLPVGAIAAELARGIDLLTTTARNAPERHRSIRTVIAQSWAQLPEAERRSLARLALFRAGFTRAAAAAVAGADLVLLTALLDKSLLRAGQDGRYSLHELLRQYATEQLEADPAARAEAEAAMATHYAQFLGEQSDLFAGPRQQAVLNAITVELDNIRAIWPALIALPDAPLRQRGIAAFATYIQMRGLYREGLAALELAEQQLAAAGPAPEARIAHAAVQAEVAHLHQRLGHFDLAATLFGAARATYDELGVPPPSGNATDPVIWLGSLAMVRGEYAAAAQLGAEAVARSERHGRPVNTSVAWFICADAARMRGQYDQAREYAHRACASAQAVSDRWQLAAGLVALGNVEAALRRPDAARELFGRANALSAEFGDLGGRAYAHCQIGQLLLAQGMFAEARTAFQESADLYQQIGDRGCLAWAHAGLGGALAACGETELARQALLHALQVATPMPFPHVLGLALVSAAILLRRSGDEGRAEGLLVAVAGSPSVGAPLADWAARLLPAPRQGRATPALAEGVGLARDALEQLVLPSGAGAPPGPALEDGRGARSAAPATLVEPLSERELEVLTLIAGGLSNQGIADQLCISVGTVKWHINQIYGKLAVHSRTQAVMRARQIALL